ncbi:MAG: hypothetical protein VX475_16205 [Myxococcota bacterium]|nr:hypothetical protein [Myxococcota bacterium]
MQHPTRKMLATLATTAGALTLAILCSPTPLDAKPPAKKKAPKLRMCTSGVLDKAKKPREWEHRRSAVVASGKPDHSAQDLLTTSDHGVTIVGKFAYGRSSKDLEDELVEILIDACDGSYKSLGSARTNDDGRIAFALDKARLPEPGVYGIVLRVEGDGSAITSTLRVFPPKTRLVVFDIDGTLTTKDAEIFEDAIADFFEPIYDKEVVPEERASAVEITQLRHAQGYPLVYLTGRPYALTRITREWLTTQGFAPGNLHVTDESEQVLPTESGVGIFKRDYLKSLTAKGFILEAAYGNAETDIFAYANANVSPARTFIAGVHGGKKGTQAVGEGYEKHLVAAKKEAAARQPFTR